MIKKYKLGELCIISSSKRVHLSDYVKTGIPFYRSKEIIELSNGQNISESLYISNEQYNEIKRKFPVPKINDILITSVGTIGISYLVKNENFYFKDGNLTWLREIDKNVVNIDFIIQWLKSNFFKKQILNNNIGAVQKAITIDYLKKVNISLPDLIFQQKIASILSNLDSKIELNNKINSELEKMAKTLYDYWFVQFDFPDENGKPYKSSGGKMVWSDELKREIPEGWGVEKISKIINLDKSGDWGKESKEGNYNQQVLCIRGTDLNGLNGKGELNPPMRYILEKNIFKILEHNDLIIEISGGSPTQSTGRLSFITKKTLERFNVPLICSNFCRPIGLKNKKFLYNFVYYWNRLYENGIFFGYEGKTSGIKNLLLESFIETNYIIVPKENIINNFYNKIESINNTKQQNLKENQKLAELRDWLLPMLMNGQVSVK